jgi:putative spermidine/putrescine transport system ATP-binding protein
MRDLIARLHAEKGITTLLVTHDRQEAMTLADRIAFLSDGRLQQYGSAPELYERPASTAVARFFGMTNLFPATIQNGIADTALGPLRLADTTLSETACIIGIRPEHVRICSGVNAVCGRIIGRTYLGQNQQVTLRCAAGTELTMLLPPDVPLAAADELTVSLPPERLRVIADTSGEHARD